MEDFGETETLEMLFRLMGDGKISPLRAIALVEQCMVMMCVDTDTWTASLMGRLEVEGQPVSFGVDSFFYIHRMTYDIPQHLAAPIMDVIRLCLHATRRIKFRQGEYSFHNAMAFHLELQGHRDEALVNYWMMKEMRDEDERSAQSPSLLAGAAELLETRIRAEEAEENETRHGYKHSFVEMIRRGKASGDLVREYAGWRFLAMYHCNLGRPTEALLAYAEAIRCARGTLPPMAVFLLLADRLHAALSAGVTEVVNQFIDELVAASVSVPMLIASEALLDFAAGLCARAGAVAAEQRLRSLSAQCLTSQSV